MTGVHSSVTTPRVSALARASGAGIESSNPTELLVPPICYDGKGRMMQCATCLGPLRLHPYESGRLTCWCGLAKPEYLLKRQQATAAAGLHDQVGSSFRAGRTVHLPATTQAAVCMQAGRNTSAVEQARSTGSKATARGSWLWRTFSAPFVFMKLVFVEWLFLAQHSQMPLLRLG